MTDILQILDGAQCIYTTTPREGCGFQVGVYTDSKFVDGAWQCGLDYPTIMVSPGLGRIVREGVVFELFQNIRQRNTSVQTAESLDRMMTIGAELGDVDHYLQVALGVLTTVQKVAAEMREKGEL